MCYCTLVAHDSVQARRFFAAPNARRLHFRLLILELVTFKIPMLLYLTDHGKKLRPDLEQGCPHQGPEADQIQHRGRQRLPQRVLQLHVSLHLLAKLHLGRQQKLSL